MKYEIVSTVDTNDGDEITRVSIITEEELELILPLLEQICKFEPYKTETSSEYKTAQDKWKVHVHEWTHDNNYPHGEMLREDLGQKDPRDVYDAPEEAFEILEDDVLPYNEYGYHTIESVEYSPVVKRIKLI